MANKTANAGRLNLLSLIGLLLLLTGLANTPVAAQEVCYEDDRGRIVTRRRPGYTRVPCPGTEAAVEAAGAREPERAAGAAVTAGEIGGEEPPEFGRRRNPVSPVPMVSRAAPDGDDCVMPGSGNRCLNKYILAALPDRWRIVDSLPGYQTRWWDPYNRNTVKADKPVFGENWFFNFSVISDTFYENREVPTPVGNSSTANPGSLDVLGSLDQWSLNQNLATEFLLYRGDTVFRPPDWEFRLIPVFNFNYVEFDEILQVNVSPRDGETRSDSFVGIQAAFIDKHLRNVSDRYDFDSLRIGIQPFSTDFRGFLFQDNQLGIRLFGTRANNRFQYNLAWFRRIEKDLNSGLNDIAKGLRDDDVIVANLYWQDATNLGFTHQFTVLHNRNREGDDAAFFDENGFIQRPSSLGMEMPRDYDVTYVGYNGDGHFGRFNLTASAYYAFGDTTPGVFRSGEVDISAGFLAAEASFDADWIRTRLSFLYGSGDDDPFDDEANGFDAVFENPQFAGADTSYWIRQSIPLIGGGRVALSTRNGVLANLRSSKDQGQSNFTNPGVWLIGVGADLDLLPELRLSGNWNYLRFDDTAVLEAARNQGVIDEEIGNDVSVSLIYRPNMIQNFVIRGAYARLFGGKGFEDLYGDDDAGYFMFNAILTY